MVRSGTAVVAMVLQTWRNLLLRAGDRGDDLACSAKCFFMSWNTQRGSWSVGSTFA